MKQKILSVFLLIIFLGSLGLMGYLGMQEAKKEASIAIMEKDLKEYIIEVPTTETIEEESEVPVETFQLDWDALLAENEDVVGWIQFVEPSRINYPIVQGESNQTYLRHDWKGNRQSAGSIFLHKGNDPNFKDANSVIYGHRMRAGSMFGSLKKYKDQSFMNEYPYFYIYTPDGKKRTYEIFAYSKVKDGSTTYSLRFETVKERLTYYEDLINRAITKRDIDLDEFDTTVTLSTCAGSGYYDRTVLMGKLIQIDVSKVSTEQNK